MKKRIYPLLLALMLAFQMTGCGGGGGDAGSLSGGASNGSPSASTDSSDYDVDWPQEEGGYTADDGLSGGANGVDGSVYDGSKLILRGSVSAEATDFDAALSAIEQQVAQAGGYVESSNVRGGSGSRWAELTVRVPREQFDAVFEAMGDNCHVTERSRSSENVSASYYDAEARRTALEIKRDRLLALLEKADKMEDILILENALSDVQYEIEGLSGTLRGYDRLIAFSTLDVYLQEVRDLSLVQEENTFLNDLRTAAATGTRSLISFVQGVLLTVVYGWWFFLLLILVALLSVRITRKRRREREQAWGKPGGAQASGQPWRQKSGRTPGQPKAPGAQNAPNAPSKPDGPEKPNGPENPNQP